MQAMGTGREGEEPFRRVLEDLIGLECGVEGAIYNFDEEFI